MSTFEWLRQKNSQNQTLQKTRAIVMWEKALRFLSTHFYQIAWKWGCFKFKCPSSGLYAAPGSGLNKYTTVLLYTRPGLGRQQRRAEMRPAFLTRRRRGESSLCCDCPFELGLGHPQPCPINVNSFPLKMIFSFEDPAATLALGGKAFFRSATSARRRSMPAPSDGKERNFRRRTKLNLKGQRRVFKYEQA